MRRTAPGRIIAMPTPSPAAVVQAQLDAYNAKDIDALLATYAADALQTTLDGEPLARGHAEMRPRFLARFAEPDLHALLLSRTVMGGTVVDHERITRNFGEGRGTVEMLCIYQIQGDTIRRAAFGLGETTVAAPAAKTAADGHARPLIRRFEAADWPALWPLLRATFAAGDTYAYPPDSPEGEARHAWIAVPAATFVACGPTGELLGSYVIKPNQPGLGSHVCNCGYIVAPEAQGQGIATALCRHSQAEAVAMGFRAMQFNLVVATNLRAVRLWERLGFARVATLPGAFRHPRLGFVDALVMFKSLAA